MTDIKDDPLPLVSSRVKKPSTTTSQTCMSRETNELRKKVSASCEQLIWDFFEGGGQVVIYDANNGTDAESTTYVGREI